MFKILNLSSSHDQEEYSTLLSFNNLHDPYFLLDYINYFGGGLVNLICFVQIEEQSAIFMPGYKRKITIGENSTPFYDFTTPYGYSGPLFTKSTNEKQLIKFWDNIDNWYRNNNVISEFIRFNLHNNHQLYSGKIHPTMLNVKGIIVTDDIQWSLFDRKVRKNVNKAIRENLEFCLYFNEILDKNIEEFYDIYIQTMLRTKARESFMYSIRNFKNFILNNNGSCAIGTIYFQDTPISSELVLVTQKEIFSFLGGTNDTYFDKRPNDFLKFHLINWARKNEKSFFILGGGFGYEDGIFNYKKSFFPNDVVTYYTGRKIINYNLYKHLFELNNKHRIKNGIESLSIDDSSFFPIYNKRD